MFKFRKIVLVLLLVYLFSMSVSAFGLPQNGTTGALEFFRVNGAGVATGQVNAANPINTMEEAEAKVAKISKSTASGIIAICVVTSLLFLAFHILKLSKCGDNPNERKKAITGIIISGAVFAGFGGYGVVTGILFNLFI